MSARVAREFGGLPLNAPVEQPMPHLKRQKVDEDDLLYSLKDMFKSDFRAYPIEKEIERPNRYDLSEGANEELDRFMREEFDKKEELKHHDNVAHKRSHPINDSKNIKTKKQQHWKKPKQLLHPNMKWQARDWEQPSPLGESYRENINKKNAKSGPSQTEPALLKKKGKKQHKKSKKSKKEKKVFELSDEEDEQLEITLFGDINSPLLQLFESQESEESDEEELVIFELAEFEIDDNIDSEEDEKSMKKKKKSKKDKKLKKDKKEKKEKKLKEKKEKKEKKELEEKEDNSEFLELEKKNTQSLNQEFKANTSELPCYSWTYVNGKLISNN